MAAVKKIEKSIKAHQYVYDSIAYILAPENRNGDEKCFQATCLNCVNGGAEDLAKQFYETRRAYGKDDNILAHHYVQSFSPNEEITPELAHQLGVELAEKIAPGFQVIVSTHIDKDHIHNHIIINSVNMETGLKWKGNKTTLNAARTESDKLCKQYGLTTIDTKSGLRGIDQATRELAAKGKSWKVDLCHALDETVRICNSKNEFIAFMQAKGFEITRYTDRHITFWKEGEKKKIRADTLAKQFGDKYTKENLEKLMGFYVPPKPLENPPTQKPPVPFVSEFEKIERKHFAESPPLIKPVEAKALQLLIKSSTTPIFYLLLVIARLLLRRKRKTGLDRKYRFLHSRIKPQKQYKAKKLPISEALKRYEASPAVAGNILYRDLVKAQGENYRVRIALSAVPKLYAYPFFFSAKLYTDYALVTIKEKDKALLQRALELEDISVLERHNEHYTAKAEYLDLKKRAEKLGVKVEFLMLHQPEQLEKLNSEKDRFVAIPTKEGKIRLAFLPQNKDFILHALYPDKYKSKTDILFSVGRNSRVNTRLKSEALLGGQKMRYRELTREQVEQLAESIGDEHFAVFSKNAKGESLNGKYNVTFKESDQEQIEEALQKPKKPKRST